MLPERTPAAYQMKNYLIEMLFNHFECLSAHGHNINTLSSRGQIDYFIGRYNFHDITAQIINRHVGICPIHLNIPLPNVLTETLLTFVRSVIPDVASPS